MIYLLSVFILFIIYQFYGRYFTTTLRLFKLRIFFNFGIILLCSLVVPLTMTSARCTCGKSNPSGLRIVGGGVTKSHEFPWQAALYYLNRGPFCGGSLLNDKYVITAGHCIHRLRPWDVTVVLGEHDVTSEQNKYRKSIQATRLILHPKFEKDGFINDIGLVKLKTAVKFTPSQSPPCLPRPSLVLDGVSAIVTGWGRVTEGGPPSKLLKKVTVPIISLAECRRAFGNYIIFSSMICGLFEWGGSDSCQGDSGGPLTYYHNYRYYLIGLVSWGVGCARPNYPGVYTRVDKFYQWIDANTADAVYCVG